MFDFQGIVAGVGKRCAADVAEDIVWKCVQRHYSTDIDIIISLRDIYRGGHRSDQMRPTSHPQSAVRNPLNRVLGTEANVRVLRVVLLSDIPIGVSELARRTALQASGVARVCARLEDLGVIEAVGRGARNRQYRRAGRYPLGGQLSALFSEERTRGERVFEDLGQAVAGFSLRCAWIEGPVARGADRAEDTLVIGVLVEAGGVESVRTSLWSALLRVQSTHDLTLELRVYTLADLETLDARRRGELDGVLPLLGPMPLDLLGASTRGDAALGPGKRHADLDARSREMARAVALRVKRDPSLVEDARRYVERRIPVASPGERLELEEWCGILDTMSVPRLCRFLVQDDARATRLRQSSPFLAVLSPEERRAVLAAARQ
jgi:DNA-binding Lrp family transcriptional regulator